MRKIRVYAIGSHQTKDRTSGVDYVRVYAPLKYVNGYKDDQIEIQVDFFDINAEKQDNWIDIAKRYDVVFLNYTVLDWQYATLASCVHGENKKIILDIDDSIWHIAPDNVAYNKMKELRADYIISCMIDDVDEVVVTNSYLKNIVADKTYKRHEHIHAIGNQVDLSLYNHTFPSQDRGDIVLMHYGSSSHYDDLFEPQFLNGVERIFKQYPNVRLKTVGAFLSQLRYRFGSRYENSFGDVDIYKWARDKFPLFMDEADIMVVPLRDTVYNRSKSDLKFIETASAMKPGVFSATRPYIESVEHGKTGYIARTADDWYNYIKELVDSHEKRLEIGTAAHEYIVNNRQHSHFVPAYVQVIKKALDIS